MAKIKKRMPPAVLTLRGEILVDNARPPERGSDTRKHGGREVNYRIFRNKASKENIFNSRTEHGTARANRVANDATERNAKRVVRGSERNGRNLRAVAPLGKKGHCKGLNPHGRHEACEKRGA
jgi:hypothetical protein